jgi:hypothetical protein
VRRVDWSSDAGWAGGGEVIPFCVLIFVIGTLMVTNLWGVIDAKMATNGAAREAARVVAESDGPTPAPGEEALGKGAAIASIQAHERDPGRLSYRLEYGDGRTGAWAPCTEATVTVEYRLSLIRLPLIGMVLGPDYPVTSTHTEIIDPYRSRAVDHGEVTCQLTR